MFCGAPTRVHAIICKRCRDLGTAPRRPKSDNEHRIAQINGDARENHRLSYGKYVAALREGNKQ